MVKQPIDVEELLFRPDPVQDSIDDLIYMLVKERKAQKITQVEISNRTGIPQSTISRIESFQTVPSLPVLIPIATVLGLRFVLTRENMLHEVLN